MEACRYHSSKINCGFPITNFSSSDKSGSGIFVGEALGTTVESNLGAVAKLLGQFWLHELTADQCSGFNDPPEVGDALRLMGFELPQGTAAQMNESIERLAIDYCQLLIGPKGHVSPVESVWVADQFQSHCVDSMKLFFDILPGYQPPSNFHDHIGVQLDFAGSLMLAPPPAIEGDHLQSESLENQTTSVGPSEDFDTAVNEITTVFIRQRMAWTAPMIAKVKVQAQTAFYRRLAEVTEQFLKLFSV
jgi:TorA maturation chaperone TorD